MERRHRFVALAVVAGLLVVLSACSPSPESSVAVAQANVTKKERALADAQSAATESAAAFCSASSTYIRALDVYGKVLNQTAVTVGDVQNAGQGLEDPSAESKDAGQAAVNAQNDVAKAEQDLADAQAALAVAEAAAAGEPSPEPTPSQSSTPAAPPASAARVQQAETEFATMQAGITANTPLAQAAQQFNSAAVALEMAWLQLFADAGCLTDEQQVKASAAVRDYTLAVQQDLTSAGYYAGAIDGIYGPQTVAAVTTLQSAHGLPQTGMMDSATEAALRSELDAAGGVAAQAALTSTAALQQTLRLAGYWTGPVDGQWTPELTVALQTAQTDLGVPATGAVDAATITAFQKALAAAQAEPTPTPTPTPEPSPSSTDAG